MCLFLALGMALFLGGWTAYGDIDNSGIEVNALNYGSPGYSTLTNILTKIGSAQRTVILDGGTWSMTDNVSVPANVTLRIRKGSLLSPATGCTVEVSRVDAGLYQVFGTAGTIACRPEVEEICPEWWGAVGGAYTTNAVTDDTIPVQLALNNTHAGVTLVLNSMYAVTGVQIYRDASHAKGRGGSIRGPGGYHNADPDRYKEGGGLSAYGSQSYVLKITGATSFPDCWTFDGVTFFGRDKTVTNGLVWADMASAFAFQSCTFTRSHGPGMRWGFIQDSTWNNCLFWSLGGNALPGGIRVGQNDIYPSNNNRFMACRFEHTAGGAFWSYPNGTNQTLFLDLCKFESPTDLYLEDGGSPLSANTTTHTWFNFTNCTAMAQVGPVRVYNCGFHFPRADCKGERDAAFQLGSGRGFSVSDSHFNVGGAYTNRLFYLGRSGTYGGMLGFEMRNNTIFAGDTGITISRDSLGVNNSKNAVYIEPARELNQDIDSQRALYESHPYWDGFVFAKWCHPSKLSPDPDSANPSFDRFSHAVVATNGENEVLAYLGDADAGQTWSGVRRFACRVKKEAGTEIPRLRLTNGSGKNLTTLGGYSWLTNTTWNWIYLDLDPSLLTNDVRNLYIQVNKSTNDLVYFDGYYHYDAGYRSGTNHPHVISVRARHPGDMWLCTTDEQWWVSQTTGTWERIY